MELARQRTKWLGPPLHYMQARNSGASYEVGSKLVCEDLWEHLMVVSGGAAGFGLRQSHGCGHSRKSYLSFHCQKSIKQ